MPVSTRRRSSEAGTRTSFPSLTTPIFRSQIHRRIQETVTPSFAEVCATVNKSKSEGSILLLLRGTAGQFGAYGTDLHEGRGRNTQHDLLPAEIIANRFISGRQLTFEMIKLSVQLLTLLGVCCLWRLEGSDFLCLGTERSDSEFYPDF
jgi:hypothetical protein